MTTRWAWAVSFSIKHRAKMAVAQEPDGGALATANQVYARIEDGLAWVAAGAYFC